MPHASFSTFSMVLNDLFQSVHFLGGMKRKPIGITFTAERAHGEDGRLLGTTYSVLGCFILAVMNLMPFNEFIHFYHAHHMRCQI